MEKVKREVYVGYDEVYMIGQQIKQYFKGCYETFGKHHSRVSSKQLDFDSKYLKVKNETQYRLFINENFCAIFDGETDKKKLFFGYTRNKPAWAKD